ncbi:MAG: hypothetical protein ACP5MW_05035 [Thermoplasmata archaeon]
MDIVNDVTGSIAKAKSTRAYLCGRSEEPLSKNAMKEWSEHSILPLLMERIPSAQSYWKIKDILTLSTVNSILLRISQRLIEHDHSPSTEFFDTTNFSTEQQPHDDPDKILPNPYVTQMTITCMLNLLT